MTNSLTESDYLHEPLDTFTDRENILKVFEQLLHYTQPHQFRILAIKGNSGTGKTFLIRYLRERIAPSLGWQTGQILQTSQLDFRSILSALEDGLRLCVPSASMQTYRIKRDEYDRRYDQYRTVHIENFQVIEAREQSTILYPSQSINADIDKLVAMELHKREQQLRTELTRALVELAEQANSPFCFFIDGSERLLNEASSDLIEWLFGDIFRGLYEASPQPMLFVTCGWESPKDAAIVPFTLYEDLTDFTQEQIKAYLAKQKAVILADGSPATADEAFLSTFYEMTKGHPLVMALAVTDLQALSPSLRTVDNWRASSYLLDEHAGIEFFEERLLKRLEEPFRTLLERGPVLRSFDQASLQTLLKVNIDQMDSQATFQLDDRTYSRFLRLPFINRMGRSDTDPAADPPTFHELVRRVRLQTLRRHHSSLTKEQLHRAMADFYLQIAEAEHARYETESGANSQRGYTDWFFSIPEKEFRARVEWFYHAMQVAELRTTAFEAWSELTDEMISRWRRQRAGRLLQLMRQLIEEGEVPLAAGETSDIYVTYLEYSSLFLLQEGRWEEAQHLIEQGIEIGEQFNKPQTTGTFLGYLGIIHHQKGEWKQALNSLEQAAKVIEANGQQTTVIFYSLMASICEGQAQWERALKYYKKDLALKEQVHNQEGVAEALNDIGRIYRAKGEWQQALTYEEQALQLTEQESNPIGTAGTCKSIGAIYTSQKKWKLALEYTEQGLKLFQQVGDPDGSAACLHNMGDIYCEQEKWHLALHSYKDALILEEQIGNPTRVAQCLIEIGKVYLQQGDSKQASDYYNRAIAHAEQFSKPIDIIGCLINIGENYLTSRADPQQALNYCQRALALGQQIDTTVIHCQRLIGSIFVKFIDVQQGLNYLEQALALAEQIGQTSSMIYCLGEIAAAFQEQGQWEQARQYGERMLSLIDSVEQFQPAEIAHYLELVGLTYRHLWQWERAQHFYERALVHYQQAGDTLNIAHVFEQLGELSNDQDKPEQSMAYFSQAVSFAEQSDAPTLVARLLMQIGNMYAVQGRQTEARDSIESALHYYEQTGNSEQMAECFAALGHTHIMQKNGQRALHYYKQALLLNKQLNNSADISRRLQAIGVVYESQGEMKEALHHYEQALLLREQIQDIDGIIQSITFLMDIHIKMKNLKQASKCQRRVLDIAIQLKKTKIITEVISNIRIYSAEDLDQHLSYCQLALDMAERRGSKQKLIALVLSKMGQIYTFQDNLEQALDSHRRALAIREQLKDIDDIAASLGHIGEVYKKQKDWAQASYALERALTLYEQSDNHVGIVEILKALGDIPILSKDTPSLKGQDFAQAIPYYERALTFLEQNGLPADIADILHTLGLFYNAVFMKDGSGTAEKQAAVYLIRALEIYDHLGENFEATVFEILKKLRDIYIGQFKWRTGLHYYLRARKLGKKLKKGKAVSSS